MSRRDRFTAKLKSLRKFLREQLNAEDTTAVLGRVVNVLRGWINYHGISDNDKRVRAFIHHSKHILFAWFNRRGRKKPLMNAPSGDWQTAIKIYRQWKYRHILEQRINTAKENVAKFNELVPLTAQPPVPTMMFNSHFSCSACHEE